MSTKATQAHQAYNRRNFRLGLCIKCPRKRKRGRKMCKYHADRYAAYERAATKRKALTRNLKRGNV